MSTLQVIENQQRVEIFHLGPTHNIDFTATGSSVSTPFAEGTQIIRLASHRECFVKIGDNPVATEDDHYVPAQQPPQTFRVRPGQSIAVTGRSQGGVLGVSELV